MLSCYIFNFTNVIVGEIYGSVHASIMCLS